MLHRNIRAGCAIGVKNVGNLIDQNAYELLISNLATFSDIINLPVSEFAQSQNMYSHDLLLPFHKSDSTIQALVAIRLRQTKLTVKDVEEVLQIMDSAGAKRAWIIAANYWDTSVDSHKAVRSGLLNLVVLEDAAELFTPGRWDICPQCGVELLARDKAESRQNGKFWLWWVGGECRRCGSWQVQCQDCELLFTIPAGTEVFCECGHGWQGKPDWLEVRIAGNGDN